MREKIKFCQKPWRGPVTERFNFLNNRFIGVFNERQLKWHIATEINGTVAFNSLIPALISDSLSSSLSFILSILPSIRLLKDSIFWLTRVHRLLNLPCKFSLLSSRSRSSLLSRLIESSKRGRRSVHTKTVYPQWRTTLSQLWCSKWLLRRRDVCP